MAGWISRFLAATPLRIWKDDDGSMMLGVRVEGLSLEGDVTVDLSPLETAIGNLPQDNVLEAGTAIIGGARDAGPQWTTVFGVSGERFTSADQSASAAAVTDAPTGGQKLVITDVLISVDTAMRVDLSEETSGDVLASFYLPANGTMQFTPRSKLKLATADKKLMVQTSAAGNIAVTAFYFSEA